MTKVDLVPPLLDRLIVHKFDPDSPAPGGIDACIRGMLAYMPPDQRIGVLGVDGQTSGVHKIGKWEERSVNGRSFYFMPICRFDPGNQIRHIPHSTRIAVKLLRYRRSLPTARAIQVHRADLGLIASVLWPRSSLFYFIHTQEDGILGKGSDSFWKYAASVHRMIEKAVVRRSSRVWVFNPEYIAKVAEWNESAKSLPTWWDPRLIPPLSESSGTRSIVWVGRFEEPKDPILAIRAMSALLQKHPHDGWKLTMVGSGNLFEICKDEVVRLGLEGQVTLTGRMSPEEVMTIRRRANIQLMTSIEGYEGFPRVLVEGLACGLPAVVTKGSDTGKLVDGSTTGIVTSRRPEEIASALERASTFSADAARSSVARLSAPIVVEQIFYDGS